jgi:hypothetical protein
MFLYSPKVDTAGTEYWKLVSVLGLISPARIITVYLSGVHVNIKFIPDLRIGSFGEFLKLAIFMHFLFPMCGPGFPWI